MRPLLARRLPMAAIAIAVAGALALPAAAQPAPATLPLAQPAPAAGVPVLRGRTLEGHPFDLASLRGKVVLVLHWSTGCAVCRDKMPEMRQNAEGWRDQPFALVLVSHDRRLQDVQEYAAVLARTVPVHQRFVRLWSGAADHRDSQGPPPHLPTAHLLDKSGRLVKSYHGRIPPQAWDDIAELL